MTHIDTMKLALKALLGATKSMPTTPEEDEAIAALTTALAEPSEELIRFCPDCGHLGDVPKTARDCCPDGQHARMVPSNFAMSCHATFMRCISRTPTRSKPVEDVDDWESDPHNPANY
jgi:hypothetical protein